MAFCDLRSQNAHVTKQLETITPPGWVLHIKEPIKTRFHRKNKKSFLRIRGGMFIPQGWGLRRIEMPDMGIDPQEQ
jgi:hypothetical protein